MAAFSLFLLAAGSLEAVQPVAQFLKLSGSSRQDALGGAYSAIGGEGDAVGANSASLANMTGLNAFFTYFSLFEGISYFRGFIGSNFKKGSLGFHMISLDSGSLEETKVTSSGSVQKTGKIFGASSQAFGLTYAHTFFWKMPVGVTAKYIREDYAIYKFQTAAADLGAQRGFFRNDRLVLGLALQNLGPGNKRSDGSGVTEPLPMTARFGIAVKIYENKTHSFLFLTDQSYEEEDKYQNGTGLEYGLYQMIFVRLGYRPMSRDQAMTAGLGFQAMIGDVQYGLDYALQKNNDLGLTNRFTMKVHYQFDSGRKRGYRGDYVTGNDVESEFLKSEEELGQGEKVFMKMILTDGTELKGALKYRSQKSVVLEVPNYGEVTAPREKIAKVKRIQDMNDD